MKTSRTHLYVLNSVRWLREHFWVWGILASIYSIALSLIVQAWLEAARLSPPSVYILAPFLGLLLLVPLVLGYVPGSVLIRIDRIRSIYFLHEIRKRSLFGSFLIVLWVGFYLTQVHESFLVFIPLFYSQYFSSRLNEWRRLFLFFRPRSGARELMISITAISLSVSILHLAVHFLLQPFQLEWGWASLGGLVAAGSMVFEGDSGRPWLGQFASLAFGLLGALVVRIHPVLIGVVIYYFGSMMNAVQQRLKAVELLDDDTLVN